MKRLGLFVLLTLSASQAIAADKDITDEFEKAAASATDETYQLQYKFKKGESYTYRVEQIATVDTTIDGNNQKTQLRSGSVRSLKVVDVDDSGNMTFEHVIDEVDMWSEVTGRQAVKYNSTTDKEAPPEFERVKDSVGTPISTITMAPNGIVVKREDKTQQPNLGMGGLSIPLPDGPVRPGHTWTNPLEIKVRLENQQIKSIKTREHYTLEKVSAGVATIKISTQVLTPVDDAKIKAQLIQQLSSGTIRFDVDAGRLMSKQLDWDESVLGFSGAGSNMKYLARFTEKLLDDAEAKKVAEARSSAIKK